MEIEGNKKQNDLHIPDDLVFNILQRLPAISLARFMCVCKQWQSMIISQVSNNNEELILVSSYYSLQSIDFNASNIEPVTLKFPLRGQRFHVVGSVNGLLCFSTEKALILWNPWTQGYKTIPSYMRRLQPPSNVYGFGYDQCTDDYIIVRIKKRTSRQRLDMGCWVDIYSCKTDFWMPKGRLSPGIWRFFDQSGFFAHGALYWHIIYVDNIQYDEKKSLIEHYDNDLHAILCFGLALREFSMILPPEIDVVGHRLDFDIAVLGGRLCMVDYHYHNCHTDIWAWEGTGSGNWIKWMSIPCLKELQCHKYLAVAPIFLQKNGEVLVDTRRRCMESEGWRLALSHETKDEGFLLYNQEKKAFRELNIRGIDRYDRGMSYTKSLVSLPCCDGGHQWLGCDLVDLDIAEEERALELLQQYVRTIEYEQVQVEPQICGHLSSEFGAHVKSSTSRASLQICNGLLS